VKIVFDPAKNAANIRDRALAFEQAVQFDFSSAEIAEDVHREYPERRFVAVGYLSNRLHVLCFTLIGGGIRVISFRKANAREGKAHEKPLYR
jgi:uncharacterized DUF497 family protein